MLLEGGGGGVRVTSDHLAVPVLRRTGWNCEGRRGEREEEGEERRERGGREEGENPVARDQGTTRIVRR